MYADLALSVNWNGAKLADDKLYDRGAEARRSLHLKIRLFQNFKTNNTSVDPVIQTRFLGKYLHAYKQTVGMIAVKCFVNLGLS
jgi:hypothetical protein